MHQIKSSDVVSLRKLLTTTNPTALAALKQQLTTSQRDFFETLLLSTWAPADQIAEIYLVAAEVLFPGDAKGCMRLGCTMARQTYSGLYRVFLAIPTLSFVVTMSAKVWSSYHSTGEAKVEAFSKTGGEFVVRGAPEIPRPILNVITGHLVTLVELTGGENVRGELDAANPNEWRWRLRWG